jgi:hypothetical protein
LGQRSGSSQQAPYIGKDQIRDLALEILEEYFHEKGWSSLDELSTDLQDIYENVLYPRYEFELVTREDLGCIGDEKVLGKVIPKKQAILIDKSIAPPNNDPRFTFTLGHEIGHSVLHRDYKNLFRCTGKVIFLHTDFDPLEFQANVFAEYIIMPDHLVLHRFAKCYGIQRPFVYSGPGEYWVTADDLPRRCQIRSYTHLCSKLAAPMTGFFSNISKQSLGLKMHKLGLVRNLTTEQFGHQVSDNSLNLGGIFGRL